MNSPEQTINIREAVERLFEGFKLSHAVSNDEHRTELDNLTAELQEFKRAHCVSNDDHDKLVQNMTADMAETKTKLLAKVHLYRNIYTPRNGILYCYQRSFL